MPRDDRQQYLSMITSTVVRLGVATPNVMRLIGELDDLRERNKMHSDVLSTLVSLLREAVEARDQVVLNEVRVTVARLHDDLPGRWNMTNARFNPSASQNDQASLLAATTGGASTSTPK